MTCSAPNICTTCHGGAYSGTADMGSMFREFEPSWLKARPGVAADVQEKEWFDLNKIIRGANISLRTNNPDDQLGYNKTVAYIDSLYPNGRSPALRIDGPKHIPATWTKTERNALLTETRKTLWTTTVGKYCQQCHRFNSKDFASYTLFEKMGLFNEDGRSEIEHYIGTKGEELFASEKNGKEKNDMKRGFLQRRGKQFMPNAFVTRDLLLADPTVLRSPGHPAVGHPGPGREPRDREGHLPDRDRQHHDARSGPLCGREGKLSGFGWPSAARAGLTEGVLCEIALALEPPTGVRWPRSFAEQANRTNSITLRCCCRKLACVVRMRSTKRLPASECVP